MSVTASIIVPTYRRDDLLARCLEKLIEQDLEPSEFEVVVADDGNSTSTQQLVESIARHARCRVIYVPVRGNRGPAAARNAAWRSSAGRVIAMTDDDCLSERSWLREGVVAIDQGADAATGKLVVPLPPRPTDYERDTSGLANAEFVTANCFVRRTALEAIGGFDERFRMAWREDSDLHFSLLEKGYRIVRAERAVVVHPVRPAPWGISIKQHRKTLFDALLFKKHPQLYRQRLGRFPASYYLIVSAGGVAVWQLVAGKHAFAAAAGAVWLGLTAEFATRRLRGNDLSPQHVAEIFFTSAVIPLISIYWRIRGAIRFRVWFAY